MNITLKIEAPELAKSIQALADALTTKPLPVNKVADSKPKKQEAADQKADAIQKAPEKGAVKPEPESEPAPKADKEETQAIDITVVRQKLAEKSQEGKQAEIKKLFANYGAKKLTEIPKEHYAELLEKAEQL
ncbi:hypothetical protein NNG64_13310 [Bacillus siamensis]|uniref:hypothetical protein n=1 Tax=Bacillus amyloliquefaciens group TaxID=1938374 RepID=UPI0002AA7E74|nr:MULTISPECIES: hypothetical protein [Bacillus amyloliquefaciens group]ASB66400.1 hypothetical protein S101413_02955 [Bacillus velezensis]MCR6614754.1 hypothetical protein [Bacillus amyloliquefaciens]MEC0384661.1 hypothetical protein [Bacillus velezensis]MEC0387636.1 hypothetical protein [Bacillus velezensis]QAV93189.1 hypothetical protein ES966_13880 [Bacillus velezensis]